MVSKNVKRAKHRNRGGTRTRRHREGRYETLSRQNGIRIREEREREEKVKDREDTTTQAFQSRMSLDSDSHEKTERETEVYVDIRGEREIESTHKEHRK